MNIAAVLQVIAQTFLSLFKDEKEKETEQAKAYVESAKDRARIIIEESATGELDMDFIKEKLLSEKDLIVSEGLSLAMIAESDVENTLTNVASIIIGALAASK